MATQIQSWLTQACEVLSSLRHTAVFMSQSVSWTQRAPRAWVVQPANIKARDPIKSERMGGRSVSRLCPEAMAESTRRVKYPVRVPQYPDRVL